MRALITDHGGATSHAAILARSRGIPAVAGLGDLSHHITNGDWVLVDGNHGVVVVRPDKEELRRFTARERKLRRHSEEVRRRHAHAYPERPEERAHRDLEYGGEYQWRREGEYHLFNPETVHKLQHATRSGRFDVFQQYSSLVNDQSKRLATLRGLFEFKFAERTN